MNGIELMSLCEFEATVDAIIVDEKHAENASEAFVLTDDEWKQYQRRGYIESTFFCLLETADDAMVIDDEKHDANNEVDAHQDAKAFILSEAQWDYCRRLKPL